MGPFVMSGLLMSLKEADCSVVGNKTTPPFFSAGSTTTSVITFLFNPLLKGMMMRVVFGRSLLDIST